MAFNGGNLLVGAGSDLSAYNQQTTKINQELAKTPAVAIGASMSLSGGIDIKVQVSNTSSAAITGARLYIVLYEDLGTGEHHYTVREIGTPQTIASLAPGANQELSATSGYTGSTAKLNAVVYLKASNGEILQAALAKTS